MGYLVNQMEKLAKETERSLKDKALLTGGTLAGTGLGVHAVALPFGHMLYEHVASLGPSNNPEYDARLASLSPIRRAYIKAKNGMFIADGMLKGFLVKNTMDAYRASPEKGLKRLKFAGKAALDSARDIRAGLMPKKLRVLSALGLPVIAAAGYGGYKGTEALLDD